MWRKIKGMQWKNCPMHEIMQKEDKKKSTTE